MIIPKGTVVTIDGKVYRTLEAQVAWNKEELESLDIEALSNLPDAFELISEKVDDLEDDVETASGDIIDIKADVSGLDGDVTSLEGRMDTAEGNISQNTFDISQAQGDITGLGMQVDGKQDKHISIVLTLEPSDWTLDQTNGFRATKTVAGVTSSNLVQVSPDVASIDDYSDNNIVCDVQSAGELQFHAKDISARPATNILVNIVIWG